jgi:ADP-heptose:LPS heptosyltransferase
MPQKILVIRFSSIGDIVLTTPVVRVLKTQLDAEIHYCTKKNFAFLMQDNPYIDRVHTLEDNLYKLINSLQQEKFDYIVDLHHNLRSYLIKQRLSAKSTSFNKLNREKWLMVNLKINQLPNVHLVDRYLDCLKPLGVNPDSLGLDFFIPEKDEVELEWLPEEFRKEFVVYALGGQHATKRLPVNRMIELCDRINKPVVLLGDKNDKKDADVIERFFERSESTAELEPSLFKLNKKTRIFNGCGKFNLNQSASLVRQANYVFTHDSGLMHIAAAFKKHIFSIWGNTIPSFGMYPYRTKFTVLENNKVNCRPCSKIGYDKCPKKHFKCMNDIVFDFYLP